MNAVPIQKHAEVPSRRDLGEIVDALVSANADLLAERTAGASLVPLPSRTALEAILADLHAILFPTYFGASERPGEAIRKYLERRLEATLTDLREQVHRGLAFAAALVGEGIERGENRASQIVAGLASRLPMIRARLGSDARAAYDGDPAATSPDETVICYPGVDALVHHRIAHELYALGVPLIPRMIAEIAHAATGIDIHPGARIGASFFIDHGTGVVIGETCVIGDRVRLYQGVTLGARSFATDDQGRLIKGRPRHPIVEDDVTIYAGATILGRITIGRGSSIGGNVWLTRGVPPGSTISQAQIRDDLFDGGAGI